MKLEKNQMRLFISNENNKNEDELSAERQIKSIILKVTKLM